MASSDLPPPTTPVPNRWRRRVVFAFVICLVTLAVGELFARFYLGLGDPPLSIADPEIEYLFAPNQHCRRFGNTITYNQYSMRATPDFPKQKTDPNELRVMVLGDSVINGGVQTDDSQTATALLQHKLQEKLHRPVLVGNISAGSWGPANLLAYIDRHGLFDADVVVIVLSSHDYADAPTFTPTVGVSPSFPDQKPILALQEGFSRYLLPRLRRGGSNLNEMPSVAEAKSEDIDASLAALESLIMTANFAGSEILVAFHSTITELKAGSLPGRARIEEVVAAAGVRWFDLTPPHHIGGPHNADCYRDDIHLNSRGQAIVADTLATNILHAIAERSQSSETNP
jgi:hypothetical protein